MPHSLRNQARRVALLACSWLESMARVAFRISVAMSRPSSDRSSADPFHLLHRGAPLDPEEYASPEAERRRAGLRRWLGRILIAGGILLLLVAAALLLAGLRFRRDMRANLLAGEGLLDGQISVAGLAAPVTVTRNAQNVPSIEASNLDDLLFAQGYMTASDRLFQMDMLRRLGAGTMAEILGPSLAQHDREQRVLQLRAAADRTAEALSMDDLRHFQAYARGVNAYITAHNGTGGADTLPVEFHILHYQPARWEPRDSILVMLVMAEELSTDFPTKLKREALSANLPADLVTDLYPVGSWRDKPPLQDPPDLSHPTAPIVQIPLDRSQSLALPGASSTLLNRLTDELRGTDCAGCRDGSNNWVVAGTYTASGAPLLSNDMHLGLNAPDIWYEAALHLKPAGASPGFDVEGFTLPGVPFVIAGRNRYVAWGFTNSGADVQDLLVEHLRKTGSRIEYERPDHSWAPVIHHPELIRVRGGRNLHLDVLTTETKIGAKTIQTPIINPIIAPLNSGDRRPLALAWTVYDPSTLAMTMLPMDSATDAASLVAAFAHFTTVSQNLVYADAHHIGYHLLGCIPIRGPAVQHPLNPAEPASAENGGASGAATAIASVAQPDLLGTPAPDLRIGSPLSPGPVDALDASQAWSGYISYDQLPSVLDPSSGIIATANARITPPNYPYAITLEWTDPYRVERIDHLLQARIQSGRKLDAAEMLRIQMDIHSEFDLVVAQRVAYALDHSSLTHQDARLLQAANILRGWNGDDKRSSQAAVITAVIEQALWPMLLAPQISAYDQARYHVKLDSLAVNRTIALYGWEESRTALELILQNTPARWLPPAFSNWNDFLTVATERSLNFIHAPQDLSRLNYGASHPVEIAHPIFGSRSFISRLLGVATGTGLHPNSGDRTTVKQTEIHFGPSERFTADLSNPDNTHANITTGESGNPASPWFLDQFQPWLQGSTFTLPLDHPTVAHTLTLTPSP